jgi:hypothetical protein
VGEATSGLACESRAGELLVEHPGADSIAALDFSTYHLPPVQRYLPRLPLPQI